MGVKGIGEKGSCVVSPGCRQWLPRYGGYGWWIVEPLKSEVWESHWRRKREVSCFGRIVHMSNKVAWMDLITKSSWKAGRDELQAWQTVA